MKSEYVVKVYVRHGYFQYHVPTAEAAVAHGEAIMGAGVYRHPVNKEVLEFLPVHKVKVCGPGLGSEYPDEFKRT